MYSHLMTTCKTTLRRVSGICLRKLGFIIPRLRLRLRFSGYDHDLIAIRNHSQTMRIIMIIIMNDIS